MKTMNIVDLTFDRLYGKYDKNIYSALYTLYIKIEAYLKMCRKFGDTQINREDFFEIVGYCKALKDMNVITNEDYWHFIGICTKINRKYLNTK